MDDYSTGNHVVKFWAEWCGPCKAYKPTFDEATASFSEATIHSVNVDQNSDLAVKYNVRGIPLTIFIKDGAVISEKSGIVNKLDLEKLYKTSFNIIEKEEF